MNYWQEYWKKWLKGVLEVEEIAELISTVGFPIFIAMYLLIRLEPIIKDLQKSVNILTIVVAKQAGVDVREAEVLSGKSGDC